MKLKVLALLAASGLALAGCQGVGPKQGVGALAGAVAGGVVGNQFGGGSGKAVATTLGVIAGGLIGSELGRSLDAQDRRRAQNAEYQALEYGRVGSPVVWRNPDSGRYGEVTPTRTYNNNSLQCREYSHTIYIDGRPETAKGTACRQPDGTWRPNS
ncbi:MAG: RT0821/Lpp0805 family surface protein [Hyphomicrobiales bacterium]